MNYQKFESNMKKPVLIDLDRINLDYEYQRDDSLEKRVKKIREKFDVLAIKAPSVSLRDGGRYYVYDGQATILAAKEEGMKSLWCMVIDSCADVEAGAFVKINTCSKKASQRDVFKAALFSGDEIAAQADRLMKDHGISVSKGGSNFKATGSIGFFMEKLKTRNGYKTLDAALGAIAVLFPDQPKRFGSIMMRGMYGCACRDDFDEICRSLKRRGVTCDQILATAVGMQAMTGTGGSGLSYATQAILTLAKFKS